MTKRNRYETEGENATTTVTAAGGVVYLPPELIHKILSHLPVKSIGRFRCVCKNWQTLLCDPKFLNIQFDLNRLRTNKVILPLSFSFMTIDFRQDDNNNGGEPGEIYEILNCVPPRFTNRIEGSCNGLLLLIDYESYESWIVNPNTHEFWKLPPLSTLDNGYLSEDPAFGFGYCSCDDSFTVVVVSNYRISSPVYMWKRNGWKRVENSPTDFTYDDYKSCRGYFVNGAIHWVGFIPPDNDQGIYAFDLAGERFVNVDTPEGLKQQLEEGEFHLAVLGGCLCLLVEHVHKRTEMWVMKEYGVRKSWIKYCISTWHEYTFFKPLFFWGGDGFVIGNDGFRLTLCSLNRKKLTKIVVIGKQFSESHDRGIWTFADSLFSPTGFKGQIRSL